MRAAPLAAFLIALGGMFAQDAAAQTSSSSTSANPSGSPSESQTSGSTTTARSTTAGQSITGSSSGNPSSSIATQTVPAPLNTTPPINPAPGTSTTNLGMLIPQRSARLRTHTLMGTSNSFQNGTNGSVQSNGVVNGTATMTPPPLAAPTTGSANAMSTTQNNGPPNAPGTVAMPTPAAPVGQ